MPFERIVEALGASRKEMVSQLMDMCRIPAIGPENGGEGEGKKAALVQKWMRGMGLAVERTDAPDPRVPGGKRPNLIARVGKGPRLWFLCHLDVVPPGDPKAWRTDPFEPTVRDGRVYGRGTEDNGQGIVAVLAAYGALRKAREKPGRPLGFAFAADGETGSEHGVEYLLRQGLFREEDSFLVPDRGVAQGDEVEVAEKAVLWIRVEVRGKQGHASRPSEAVNAHRAGAFLLTLMDANLPRRFRATDPLFRPWTSTFEPTKHEPNVSNVNTIPGEDVFYFDCRILPCYKPKEVLAAVEEMLLPAAKTFGVQATIEVIHEESSPPTPLEAPVVKELLKAIRTVRGISARPVGIGGGTLAAPLRRKGFPVAVWSTTEETSHGVDESARIDNLVADAKVFAALMAGPS